MVSTHAEWRVAPGEHHEGTMTERIEHYTSMAPSGLYLTLAVTSMAASALLQMSNRKQESLFIGQWAPAFLLMGLYNKLVKIAGSD